MKAQAGFTLVEVLTAGVLSTVLAGAIISILYLGTDQIEESLARQDAVALYTVVAEHIQAVASRADSVRSTEEEPGAPLDPTAEFADVIFVNAANEPLGGFKVRPDGMRNLLMEWSTADDDWVPYTIAGIPIELDALRVPAFYISPERRSATFQFNLLFTKNGKTTTHKFPVERAQCKNRFP